ncbi:MAG: hypothetical protein KGI60_00690 [Patescibacteria group bacterium]|nr:hypothetical protein [Patescibacteria group bacterium]
MLTLKEVRRCRFLEREVAKLRKADEESRKEHRRKREAIEMEKMRLRSKYSNAIGSDQVEFLRAFRLLDIRMAELILAGKISDNQRLIPIEDLQSELAELRRKCGHKNVKRRKALVSKSDCNYAVWTEEVSTTSCRDCGKNDL